MRFNESCQMQSHCLRHQDKVATARCSSCSIPLCDECVQPYAEGKFCSDRCHKSALEGKVRAAELQAQHDAVKRQRQTKTAIKTIIYVALGFALFFGWDYLPEGFTSFVDEMLAKVKAAWK